MKLQEYSHDDPKLDEYTDALEPYVGHQQLLNPYQVFLHDNELVGFVVVSKEPFKLIEPIGTPLSNIIFVDYTKPVEVLKEFADCALRIAKERNVAYSIIDIPTEHSEFVDHFMSIGYSEIAHSLRMNRSLEDYVGESCNLIIVKVERDEVFEFIDKLTEFMSGSQDNMLNIIFGNIVGLPEQFVDQWFNSTNLNYVYDKDVLIGILELSPKEMNIANIGVAPSQRRKGYGKQIMQYALKTLKEQNIEFARLRVHAENEKAIHLYESLLMTQASSYRALIWRK